MLNVRDSIWGRWGYLTSSPSRQPAWLDLWSMNLSSWLSSFHGTPLSCRCQDYFPDEKKFAQVLKETPEMDWAEAFSDISWSVNEVDTLLWAWSWEISSCSSRTCTTYVGLERVCSLAQFILEWKVQQKIISALSYTVVPFRACYRKHQMPQEHFLWLATSESWWISMGLRPLTIGKMLEDQSGRQQAQWGSPVRAVWFVVLDVKVMLCYKWRTNT